MASHVAKAMVARQQDSEASGDVVKTGLKQGKMRKQRS
jgi:hypothetical protein